MAFTNSISWAGRIGKSLGYVMWAISSGLTLATRFGRNVYDKASEKPKYDVTVHVQGVELSVKRSIYGSEVSKLIDSIKVLDGVEVNVALSEDSKL